MPHKLDDDLGLAYAVVKRLLRVALSRDGEPGAVGDAYKIILDGDVVVKRKLALSILAKDFHHHGDFHSAGRVKTLVGVYQNLRARPQVEVSHPDHLGPALFYQLLNLVFTIIRRGEKSQAEYQDYYRREARRRFKFSSHNSKTLERAGHQPEPAGEKRQHHYSVEKVRGKKIDAEVRYYADKDYYRASARQQPAAIDLPLKNSSPMPMTSGISVNPNVFVPHHCQ